MSDYWSKRKQWSEWRGPKQSRRFDKNFYGQSAPKCTHPAKPEVENLAKLYKGYYLPKRNKNNSWKDLFGAKQAKSDHFKIIRKNYLHWIEIPNCHSSAKNPQNQNLCANKRQKVLWWNSGEKRTEKYQKTWPQKTIEETQWEKQIKHHTGSTRKNQERRNNKKQNFKNLGLQPQKPME